MKLRAVFLVLPLLCAAVLKADIIYDNSNNFLLKINSTELESGDQVQFAGDNRVLTYFAFEYFATPSAAAHGASARVRFYLNNGPADADAFAKPGTLVYDSGSFLLVSNASTVEISGLSLYIPSDTLTWTVQFSGIATNEKAGVLFYDPPQVGSSGDFLWQREETGWQRVVASTNVVNNLSARFEALPGLRIKDLQLQDKTVSLTALATAGKSYALEYKSSVDQQGWIPVEHSTVTATGSEVTLVDPSGGDQPLRIYRVVERDLTSPPQ